ncbi:MAG: hypothetical protein GTN76_10600 [Candidatus Aenigmarchaeota archaeon]|nr:hypothetical protein [Candidatus Aenigmarchaeota archaeon]
MIEVTERKLLEFGALEFSLRSGGETGSIYMSLPRETGRFELSGKSYTFRPKGMLSAVRILEDEGRVLAHSKESLFRWPFKVVYLNKTYKLVDKGTDTFVTSKRRWIGFPPR